MTTTTIFWTLRRKLWAMATAVMLLVLAAAGHWLPDLGLRYGLIRSLREMGWARVSVSDADLSLFNGAIVIHRVEAGEDLGKTLGIAGLELRFRWLPLLSRRVSVDHLDLQGVAIDIHREGAKFVINGLPVAVGGTAPGGSDWSYDIAALTLNGSRIDFSDGAVAAVILVDTLEIADLKSWEPTIPVRYRLTGRVNGAPITLEGTATPFADAPNFALKLSLDALDLASVAEWSRRSGAGTPSGRATADVTVAGSRDGVKMAGTLGLKDAAWDFGTTRIAAGALTLKADAVTYEPKAAVLSWTGALHAERHWLAFAQTRIDHGRLDWTGTTRINLAANAAPLVHAEGKAASHDLRIAIGTTVIEAAHLAAEGEVEHPLAGQLNANAEQLWLREGPQDWLHADTMAAQDLRLAPLSVVRLDAHNLAALARRGGKTESYPWRFEARDAVLDHANWANDGAIAAATLNVTGATARITRTKAGLVGLPRGKDGGESQALALGKLRISGDSHIEFDDTSLSEPVHLRLDGLDVTMSDLDSTKPERDSPFTAKARLGAARLAVQGRARLFAARPGGELKGDIHALELPPLSPYAADSLGVYLQTGQLDATIAMGATQGKLDGAMQLTLSELFIAQPDPNAKLAKRADMPMETVLDLLRDSDNRIKLSIPVRGDLTNPDFDISDAVNQTIGAALKSTVFTTLKVAFPLAGLISLVIDDSESRRLALEPLTFQPGAEALGEAERKRLMAVAKLMGEHRSLKLTLCGTAQPSDWPALVERKRDEELGLLAKIQKLVGNAGKPVPPVDMDRLSQLADGRAQAAKAFLVDQAAIDPGRLFTCRPRVETDGKSLPRVDLVL